MNTSKPNDYAISDRNGIVENRHAVHAAVVDSTGRLLFSLGDHDRMTLIRSAAKPAQALAILETGCFERYGFDDADLALMCASHSSEDRHISRAKAILARTGISESKLQCGGHPPLSNAVSRQWTLGNLVPSGIHNNCSAKHTGMIAASLKIGADVGTYHQPDHPLQKRVAAVVQDLTGATGDEVLWAVDGCNLPAPAVRLICGAKMYAKLADSANAESLDRRQAYEAKIYNAMSQYPEMVAGDGRFCTILMKAYQGALIGKIGADGCYGIGIRESEDTRRIGAEGSVGIMVKIEDGNIEVLYAVVCEVLERLDIGSKEQRGQLDAFRQSERYNTAGVAIGSLSMAFTLRKADV